MEKLIRIFRTRQDFGFTFEQTVSEVQERFTIADGFLAWKAAEILNRPWVPDYRDLPKERNSLRKLLDQALLADDVQERLEKLQQQGALAKLFPEVQAMVGFGGKGHKDLWKHTKQVVAQSPREADLRWASLFHDVGKVPTYAKVGGKVTFHNHEAVGARMFREAARRTQLFSEIERRVISNFIRNLGYVEGYSSEWTESAVRRVYREVTPRYFDALLDLSGADITTKYDWKREAHWGRIEEFRTRAVEIARKDAAPAPLPKGLGSVVSKTFGVPESPALGDIMKKLIELVKAEELPVQGPAEDYIAFIKAHPERFQK
jgi:poly(A) polymerase